MLYICYLLRPQIYEKEIIQTNNSAKNEKIQRNNSSEIKKIQRNILNFRIITRFKPNKTKIADL